ncbi:MAG TPA: septum formation protein Maf [Candidatus Ornithospirochaeta avicola]|uniref:Nucleoside triphosphate pyrophosphatase n=1 Tax=Candidatus Ornithospirochaeta avicola TaxID=2840896 RepID=A0A9D1PTT9_9SPIO|nr:septum formation protein Maf [Candidatus Ornithospirochaeta avicola]
MKKIEEPSKEALLIKEKESILTLASSSENRRKMLEDAGIKLRIYSPNIEEKKTGSSFSEILRNISRLKMENYISSSFFDERISAISCDTLVLFSDSLLGKPESRKEAFEMLSLFSSKAQEVITGITVYNKNSRSVRTESVISRVIFKSLSEHDINEYLDTGDYIGAAGAYRIQKNGYRLISRIEGSWSNVVGLPLEMLYKML